MQEQGIPPSAVDNAITYGEVTPGRSGATRYYDSTNHVTVVVDNASGKVITADFGDFRK